MRALIFIGATLVAVGSAHVATVPFLQRGAAAQKPSTEVVVLTVKGMT